MSKLIKMDHKYNKYHFLNHKFHNNLNNNNNMKENKVLNQTNKRWIIFKF